MIAGSIVRRAVCSVPLFAAPASDHCPGFVAAFVVDRAGWAKLIPGPGTACPGCLGFVCRKIFAGSSLAFGVTHSELTVSVAYLLGPSSRLHISASLPRYSCRHFHHGKHTCHRFRSWLPSLSRDPWKRQHSFPRLWFERRLPFPYPSNSGGCRQPRPPLSLLNCPRRHKHSTPAWWPPRPRYRGCMRVLQMHSRTVWSLKLSAHRSLCRGYM